MAAPDPACAMRGGVAAEDLVQAGLEIDGPFLPEPGHVLEGLRREADREGRRGVERGVHFVDPASLGVGEGIVGRDVRLDVEDRRAVDQVAGAEDQFSFLDLDQLHRSDAERIRSMRGARGEDAAPFRRAARREHFGSPVGVTVEPPDQPDAIEAFQVLERLLEFVARQHLQDVGLGLFLVGLVSGVELQRLP